MGKSPTPAALVSHLSAMLAADPILTSLFLLLLLISPLTPQWILRDHLSLCTAQSQALGLY